MTGNRERVALACFVAGALLAGGNGVSIRFSNRELAPLWGAGLRFSLAAASCWWSWRCCACRSRGEGP